MPTPLAQGAPVPPSTLGSQSSADVTVRRVAVARTLSNDPEKALPLLSSVLGLAAATAFVEGRFAGCGHGMWSVGHGLHLGA